MSGVSAIGLLTSFGAAVISFLSPCVLPLVPGYVSYVAGEVLTVSEEPRGKLAALGLSLCFVVGFSTVFVILGASATSIANCCCPTATKPSWSAARSSSCWACFMMGLAEIPWLQREFRLHLNLGGGRPITAYVIGVAFALGWTPCIGPVLGAILTTSAVSATVPQGVALLSFYSIGLGVPFLAAAVFTDSLLLRLRVFRRLGRALQLGAGVIVAGMGVAMLTDEMTSFSYWLLDTFPILGRLG
jgi:cytochrome c-type biogenesis protein